MMKEVLTGCFGVVMLSDRLIILGVPLMLSWEWEDDFPEDLRRARRFYAVVAVDVAVGLFADLFLFY